MDKYIWLSVWMYYGLPLVKAGCSSFDDVFLQSRECAHQLEIYERQSFTGQLDNENKIQACEDYEEAMACMMSVIADCENEDSPDTHVAQSMRDDMANGFGKICTEDNYFERYLTHSECYKRVSQDTEVCLEAFKNAPGGEEDEYENIHDTSDEDPMCSALEQLESCVTDVVQPLCGSDAAFLFVDLCRQQVPDSLCEPRPSELRTTPASTGSTLMATTSLFLWTCITVHRVLTC